MKNYSLILLLWGLVSCTENASKEEVSDSTKTENVEVQVIENELKSNVRPNEVLKLGQVYHDTIEFKKFDENYDYYYLFGKKDQKEVGFVYHFESAKYPFNWGDKIVVDWEMDSIWIAGDGDKLDFAETVMDARKIKEGAVSEFKTKYNKPLKYSDMTGEYSETGLYEIYRLVEYYLANAKMEVLQYPDLNLYYSIEKRSENGKEYTVIGIGNDTEEKVTTFQWLYIEFGDEVKLYEYDVANDVLVLFKQ